MFAMTDGEWTLPTWLVVLALLAIFVPWFSYACWAGQVAKRKGHSFGVYFMLGLVVYALSFVVMGMFWSWFPGALMLPLPILGAYVLADRRYVYRSPNRRSAQGLWVDQTRVGR